MANKLEKFIGQLSGFERITIVVSAFYCLGLIIRMQSEILFGLPSFIEINRALPFAVAIQYMIFLFVPILVVILPWYISRLVISKWVRCLIWCLTTSFLLIAFPMMFHYFIPYTYALVPATASYFESWLYIVANFWKVYLSWGSHLLGFGFLLVSCALPSTTKQHGIIRKGASIKWIRWALVFLALITNIFYFNSSVYCNISQGVFGAARSYGVLTIRSPQQSLLDEYYSMPSRYVDQFSFPCSIEGKSDDWLIVSKMKRVLTLASDRFEDYDPAKNGLIAIKMDDVLTFNPINLISYKVGDCEKMVSAVMADALYRMDAELRINCVVTNGVNSISLANKVMGDKKANLSWFIDGSYIGGSDFCRTYPIVVDSSNVVVNVLFPQVSSCGIRTIEDISSIACSTQNCITIRLDGMCEAIAPYEPRSINVSLICNFFYHRILELTEFELEPDGGAWMLYKKPLQE